MDLPTRRSRSLPTSHSKENEAPSFPSRRFDRNGFFTKVSAKDGCSGGEDPPGRRSSFGTKGSTKEGGGNRGNHSNSGEDGRKEDLEASIGKIIGGDGRGTEDDNDSMGGSDGSVSCSFSNDDKGIFNAYECKGRFDTVYEDKDGSNTSTVTNNLADYLPTALKDAHAKNAAKTNSDNVSSSANSDEDSTNSDKRRRKPQIVSWLPWRDQRGVLGTYTGQINRFARPHGCGVLIYEDGSAVTSIWEDGVPIKSWVPGDVKDSKKEPHKQRSRSGSSSSSSSNHADIANGIAKKQQQQSSGRSRSSSISINSEDVDGSNSNWTYLPHLDLGDAGTPRDMIQLKSGRAALETLDSQLQMHDFAFVLRSDGRWTYAIIAEKRADIITFVVDGDGQTKTMSRRHWSGLIRLANPREATRSCGDSDGGNEGSNGSKREEKAVDGKGSPGRGPSQKSI